MERTNKTESTTRLEWCDLNVLFVGVTGCAEVKTRLFSSALHAHLSFPFFSFYQPITSTACICSECE